MTFSSSAILAALQRPVPQENFVEDPVVGRWSKLLADPFIDFVGVESGESLLDVGCGTGRLSIAAASRCSLRTLTGVTSREEDLTAARLHFDNRNASFWVSNLDALPFTNHQFDRVLSLGALQGSVSGAMRVLQEMTRVARPGATVAAAVWDMRGGMVAYRMFWDTAAAIDPEGLFLRARQLNRPFTRPGELAGAFAAVGLEDIRLTPLLVRTNFSSFEEFWTPFRVLAGATSSFIDHLRPERRGLFEQKLRLAYLDGERDGPRSYAALAFAASGVAPALPVVETPRPITIEEIATRLQQVGETVTIDY